MRWPPPRAQTAQPERWRMRRWSKEPRRMSEVEGSEVASLARASRVLSECFIYIYETIREGPMSRAFQTFLQDFVFLIQRPNGPRTEPVRTGPITARLSPLRTSVRKSEHRAFGETRFFPL